VFWVKKGSDAFKASDLFLSKTALNNIKSNYQKAKTSSSLSAEGDLSESKANGLTAKRSRSRRRSNNN
jgi:hypothetical protein